MTRIWSLRLELHEQAKLIVTLCPLTMDLPTFSFYHLYSEGFGYMPCVLIIFAFRCALPLLFVILVIELFERAAICCTRQLHHEQFRSP